jgi:hypothetical protein
MKNFKKNCSLLFLLIFMILMIVSAGCISSPAKNTSSSAVIPEQPRVESTPQYIVGQYWIKIDPIDDFQSESPFTVTGTTKFNITMTTNFPEGSLFWVKIVEEERSRDLMPEVLILPGVNKEGVNSLSYPFDVQNNPPAHYRIEIRKANQNLTATEEFRIILNPSKEPWLWVHIDPIRWNKQGENLTITGTTNLPVESEISVESRLMPHTCTIEVPGSPPIVKTGVGRTYCGRGCNEEILQGTVTVIKGIDGINSWKYSLNTSYWCTSGRYVVSAEANNRTNVTTDYQEFPFG